MSKALTKEDLIYILQVLLKLSQNPDNALHRADDDGLYVKDYSEDIADHIGNKSVHVTQTILDMLARITVDKHDELLFDGKQLANYISKEENNAIIERSDGWYAPTFRLSKKEGNALSLEPDGLYTKNMESTSHIDNADIHVTQEDKKKWNSANQYTDQEISKLPIHDFCFTTQFPTENIDDTMLYFLANDPDRPLECTYTVYIHREGQWCVLGVTNKTLSKYMTTEQFTQATTAFIHSNQDILDALSADTSGNLCFNGKSIFEVMSIAPDALNAIKLKNGKLYARDYSQEIESLMTGGSFLVKINLYDSEISESGKYKLKDSIDNYNLILVEYYYKPNKPDKGTPGCIQTAVIDPDTLNSAYSMGMLYILQYGYGVMTSNSQIHIVEDELTVDYYNNVCIYRITGIKKIDSENNGDGDDEPTSLLSIKDTIDAVWENIDNDTDYDWLDNNQQEEETV